MKNIQHYTTQGEIGRGGTATVYLVHDPQTGQPLAIKLMHEKLQDNGRARERFAREAEMVAGLNHPAIVPALEFGEVDGRMFIVMPYMAGGSLRQRVEAGPLTVPEAITALEPVASALDAMHQRNIIHRDVKPHNILLDENGRAYLSDFGVARLVNPDGDEHTVTFTGTPEFVAPEQVTDGALGPRTDVYQLGVTLFYLLTARRPFTGTSFNVALQHLNKPMPLAEDLNPALPPGCDAVIQRATAKDPQARFASASEMLGKLAKLDQGQSRTNLFDAAPHSRAHGSVIPRAPQVANAPVPAPRKPTVRRATSAQSNDARFGIFAAIALVLAAVLGGATYVLANNSQSNTVQNTSAASDDTQPVQAQDTSAATNATANEEPLPTATPLPTPTEVPADSAPTTLNTAPPGGGGSGGNQQPPPGGGGGGGRGGRGGPGGPGTGQPPPPGGG